jgi:hypothetical protein
VSKGIHEALFKFNSSKVGRNRRGRELITDFSGVRRIDDRWLVEIVVKQGARRTLDMLPSGMKFGIYGFYDHKKLWRTLSEYEKLR